MKRLSFAASIAASVITLTTVTPAHAVGIDTATSPLAKSIAISARGVASAMGSVGYCYRGVKRALKQVGFSLTGGEAYMAKEQFADNPEFEQVALDDLHIGDILVHGASGRHPHGHIAVYLGEGMEASDHLGHLITGARYGGTTVWRVKPEVALAPVQKPAVALEAANSLDHSFDVDAKTSTDAPEMPETEVKTSEQPVADAAVVSPVAAPAPAILHNATATNDFTQAMMQVVQMAQSAQINLTQALAEAVGALAG